MTRQRIFVLINIGANKIANIDPPAHGGAVRRIVKYIGGRPCVWIFPPLWRKEHRHHRRHARALGAVSLL